MLARLSFQSRTTGEESAYPVLGKPDESGLGLDTIQRGFLGPIKNIGLGMTLRQGQPWRTTTFENLSSDWNGKRS